LRDQHLHTVIHQLALDVADGTGIFDQEFLHFDVVRYILRRLSAAGEDELRPVRLELRGGFAGELEVELLALGGAFGLIDRYGLPAIGEASRLAQEDVRDLVIA
jgi:hypothetical protein